MAEHDTAGMRALKQAQALEDHLRHLRDLIEIRVFRELGSITFENTSLGHVVAGLDEAVEMARKTSGGIVADARDRLDDQNGQMVAGIGRLLAAREG